jgi:hypothetical protein
VLTRARAVFCHTLAHEADNKHRGYQYGRESQPKKHYRLAQPNNRFQSDSLAVPIFQNSSVPFAVPVYHAAFRTAAADAWSLGRLI